MDRPALRPRSGLGLLLLGHNRLRLLLGAASVAFGVVVMVVEIALLTRRAGFPGHDRHPGAGRSGGDECRPQRSASLEHAGPHPPVPDRGHCPALRAPCRVYEGHVGLKSPDDNRVRRIIVYAVPPDDMPLAIGDKPNVARLLKFSHGFLYDRARAPYSAISGRASRSRSTRCR